MVIVLPIVKAYNSSEFCDLTITCGASTFRVHKAVVCFACEFFKKACQFRVGREAEDNLINLPEDDSEMVRRLIMYCYLRDYDPTSSEDLLDIETFKDCRDQGVLSKEYHRRYPSYDSDIEFFDDSPSQCACCVISDEYFDQDLRYQSAGYVEEEAQLENPLTVHATMYALADKYDVHGLAKEAADKFEATLHEHWDTRDFVTSVRVAYSSTPEGNRGLRDAVVCAFRWYLNIDLKTRPDIENQLADFDVLSLELLKAQKSEYESQNKAAQQDNGAGSQRFILGQSSM